MSSTVSSQGLLSMAKRNGILYSVNSTVTLWNSRSKVRFDSTSQTYNPGSTISVSLSNSDIYVNGRNSYLNFKLTITGAGEVFGEGSSANIFDIVRMVDSSGVEITHNRQVGLYNSIMDKLNKSNRWRTTIGVAKGIGLTAVTGNTYDFSIPLADICPVFSSEQMVPPMLLSGSRLELVLAPNAQALVSAQYVVSDCHVMLDSAILSDSTSNTVENLSAQAKIDFVFDNWTEIEHAFTANSGNLELTKSLGLARAVYVVSRDTADIALASEDFYKPLAGDVGIQTYFMRANSQTFPQLPTRTLVEGYLNTMDNLSEITDYTLDDYSVTGSGYGQVVKQSLQRSDFIGRTSGLPVSASSSLRINLTFASALARTVSTFIVYNQVVQPILYDRIIISV